MQAVIWLLSITLFASAIDTSLLKVSNVKKAKVAQPSETSKDYFDVDVKETEITDLKQKISAMQLILTNNPDKRSSLKLHLRHASLNLKLADILNKKKQEGMLIKFAVADAKTSAKYAIRLKEKTVAEHSVALYLLGMSLVFEDKPVEAIKQFQKSLKLEPESKQALPMFIFQGEYFFGTQKFRAAEAFYEKALKLNRKDHRNYTKYKLAWCQMNQKKYVRAEKLFLEVVNSQEGDELKKESLNDLAFLNAKVKGEKRILDFGNTQFGKEPDRLREFFLLASAFLSDQGQLGKMPNFVEKVLSYQENSVGRIKIYLLVVSNRRSKKATKSHYDAFLKVVKEVEDNKLSEKNPEFQAIIPDVATSAESLIKMLSEGYANSSKAQRGYSKKEISQNLNFVVDFYLDKLNSAENTPVVMNVKIGLCLDEKKYDCAYKLTTKIIKNRDLEAFHDQAKVDKIETLSFMSAKNPKRYKKEFVRLMESYVKKPERDENWIAISKRLAATYQVDGRHKKALPLLNEVHNIESSDNSLYMLNLSKFELGQYDQLVKPGGKKGKSGPKDDRLRVLEREAALKLVIKAKKKGNFKAYESNMQKYLSLGPEGEKAAIAVKDYLLSLYKKKQYTKVTNVLLKVPPRERGSAYYKDILITTLYTLFAVGRLADAFEIMKGVPSDVEEIMYMQILSKMARMRRLDPFEFKNITKLNASHRQHVLELMTLGIPKTMLKYFWYSQNRTEQMKKMAFLAVKLIQGKQSIQLSFKQAQALNSILPQSMKAYPRTRTEKLLIGIQFPNARTKAADSVKMVQKAAGDLAKSREMIGGELQNVPLRVRSRILEIAIRNERKMAITIESSPAPKGVTGAKLTAYRGELKKLARQYRDQARDYEKLNNQVRRKVSNINTEKGFITLFDVNDWPWSNSNTTLTIRNLIKNKSTIGALIVSDFSRGQKLVSEKEFWTNRAGILLSRWPGWQGVNYVKAELRNAGQSELLQLVEGG